jgi:hypothetical protein
MDLDCIQRNLNATVLCYGNLTGVIVRMMDQAFQQPATVLRDKCVRDEGQNDGKDQFDAASSSKRTLW